ncbi:MULTISPECIES: hypothetical protein [Curtobacterium]|uniref:hypothetical protein n=1 Tax=Curtobacterium TaxID=2034 RepID=UPI0015F5B647|nr:MULTISPECIES: hypothetical protein [Curtobacterium]MCS6561829.1 hypothetical protein [Curtobacterium flaccumfaciens pv. poinsettiae]UXN28847.1 hypothetical protein N8D75_00600 [Curtobacterium flaccumfaciens]
MSEPAAAPKPPKKGNRRAWVILAVWAFGVVVSLVVLLVWPYWMSAYDETHRRTISCSVSSTEVYAGSTVSRTGLGAPFSYVKVETRDCGVFILQGVRKSSQERVARDLSGGGTFQFSVGASSWWFRDALQVINRYPTAFEYK